MTKKLNKPPCHPSSRAGAQILAATLPLDDALLHEALGAGHVGGSRAATGLQVPTTLSKAKFT